MEGDIQPPPTISSQAPALWSNDLKEDEYKSIEMNTQSVLGGLEKSCCAQEPFNFWHDCCELTHNLACVQCISVCVCVCGVYNVHMYTSRDAYVGGHVSV